MRCWHSGKKGNAGGSSSNNNNWQMSSSSFISIRLSDNVWLTSAFHWCQWIIQYIPRINTYFTFHISHNTYNYFLCQRQNLIYPSYEILKNSFIWINMSHTTLELSVLMNVSVEMKKCFWNVHAINERANIVQNKYYIIVWYDGPFVTVPQLRWTVLFNIISPVYCSQNEMRAGLWHLTKQVWLFFRRQLFSPEAQQLDDLSSQ